MNAPRPDLSLQRRIKAALVDADPDARLDDGQRSVSYRLLATRSWIEAPAQSLDGRNVLLLTRRPLNAALALITLDGVAASVALCPPDLDRAYLPQVIADAAIDLVVHDGGAPETPGIAQLQISLDEAGYGPPVAAMERATRWVLFTSGTSGPPKMVEHSLRTLTTAIARGGPGHQIVWATFYDVRRYGGLQMLLRALTGGHAMLLTTPGEPIAAFAQRLADGGATHISGTPTHWRNGLMNPVLAGLTPAYVRLSGEIADQPVLDRLKAAFPGARQGHAFASTEAGVAFEVNDGLEGFPQDFLSRPGPVEMKVRNDVLCIRSPGAAKAYVGPDAAPVADAEGFVDTGDVVEARNGRLYFKGRANGVINVGGLKVHPAEVEAVINRVPGVRLSLVKGRRNPIVGAIVMAEVEPVDPAADAPALREAVLALCRAELAPFKIPASVKIVDAIAVTAGGKLERRDA